MSVCVRVCVYVASPCVQSGHLSSNIGMRRQWTDAAVMLLLLRFVYFYSARKR